MKHASDCFGSVCAPMTDEELHEAQLTSRKVEAAQIENRLPTNWRRASLRPSARAALRSVAAPLSEALRGWDPSRSNLLLCGHTGAGKSLGMALKFHSLLAVGVRDGGEAWDMARGMVWAHTRELQEAGRSRSFGIAYINSFINTAKRATVLFLDELGWDRDHIDATAEVIGHRYDHGLPTVFTFGQRPEKIDGIYTDAISRRIMHGQNTIVALAFGKSAGEP